jgi:hypothetical protein
MGLDASSISSVFVVFLGGVDTLDLLFLPDMLERTAVVVVVVVVEIDAFDADFCKLFLAPRTSYGLALCCDDTERVGDVIDVI